ncbi:hypothetical protein STVA_44530 [Allostella vacuolata]|nr:hypothetical protein STVA_44530 [Stella vacuolata]
MRPHLLAILATALLLAPSLASARKAKPDAYPSPPDRLSLRSVEALQQSTLEPRLGNGSVAEARDWPASFFAREAGCTATLIAPRVLLTAGHCIADGGRVEIASRGLLYEGTCEAPRPGYPTVQSADWMLCLMDKGVPDLQYERVSLDAKLLVRNRQLLLAGYGCTAIGGGRDEQFRTGPTFVEFLPGEIADQPHWAATFSGRRRGDAFVCEGDSGGAVFVEQPLAARRLVVAVNSHRDGGGEGISFLSVLSTAAARTYVTRWADRHGQRLCGVHADASRCR